MALVVLDLIVRDERQKRPTGKLGGIRIHIAYGTLHPQAKIDRR
jgi:hypothetical protein